MRDPDTPRAAHRLRAWILGLYIWRLMPLQDRRTSRSRRRRVVCRVWALSRRRPRRLSMLVRLLLSARQWMVTSRSPPSRASVFQKAAMKRVTRRPSLGAGGSNGYTSLGRPAPMIAPVAGARALAARQDNALRLRPVGPRDRRCVRRATGMADISGHWFRRRDPLHSIPHPSCMPPPPHRSLLCIHALLSSSSHHIICIISPSTSYILSVIASHFRHDTLPTMTDPYRLSPADAALPFLPHHPHDPYVGRAVLCLPLRSSFLVTTSPCG